MLKQTVAVNGSCAPSATLAVAGEMETGGEQVCPLVTVTLAVADFEGSATLVATMVTVAGEGTVAGAV